MASIVIPMSKRQGRIQGDKMQASIAKAEQNLNMLEQGGKTTSLDWGSSQAWVLREQPKGLISYIVSDSKKNNFF